MNPKQKLSPLVNSTEGSDELLPKPSAAPDTENAALTETAVVKDGLPIAIPTVTVKTYVRHSAGCPKRGVKNSRCQCPKWIYLNYDGKDRRFSAKTRSWTEAERKRKEIEDRLDPMKAELKRLRERQEAERITISDAVELFLADAAARNLAPQMQVKFRTLLCKGLLPWSEHEGIRYLNELTTPRLTKWRSEWPRHKPVTKQTYQKRVITFFWFCVRQEWLKQNPARMLTRILVPEEPTDYFPREEFERLVQATDLFDRSLRNKKQPNWNERLRIMLLLMRWSGLRIGDAVILERERLTGNDLLLHQAKTKEPVFVPLPREFAESLRQVPPGEAPNPRYFFWSGNNQKGAVGMWGRAFDRLFQIADIRKPDGTRKRCRSHMLRDTFAVEMLLAGVPIDQVSMLLGHTSIKTTEKHYLPWVRARQEQLKRSVKKAHSVQGVTRSATNVVDVVRKRSEILLLKTKKASATGARCSAVDPKRSAASKRAWITIRANRQMAQLKELDESSIMAA